VNRKTTGLWPAALGAAGTVIEAVRLKLCWVDSYDAPRDWPSWRAQVAHHMPRFR
jgi:hypothetical protein